ncbi:uncharacterized protein THITE_2045585 [Thermothielavioides terrestris NRRL 8126]|uniref:Uncharacterized protein n=1 Tax=Thermothielavioides terrestris (strain ATCC 38088 / NRRL 8126) TaxID=578455 RepID=G2R4G9_THETT|nr:uncharacterized protein THITE_2045585 [Thermothielavioides terrestris NRRL 8126]AEO66913.1 hypothetical protein THITE_2045585 [Thermothielavioides terrestris NRRL 8126]
MEPPNVASLNGSTLNAIDAHVVEIASLRRPMAEADDTTDGSVLAVVTFPKDSSSACACDGSPWQDVHIRMSYEKLVSLGSGKIQDMLTPRAQARFRRRLGLEQPHQLPTGIKYVVDFTPPPEGPELADLTAALWLPRVAKLWFLAGHFVPDHVLEAGPGVHTRPLADKAVGAILALGHDDVCKGVSCLTNFGEWQTKEAVSGITDENDHVPAWRRVEDYCPIRHRVAIIRVLRAINGDSLLLNSAVRLWTVAQVAISLDVPQVVVNPVAQWLVAPPNTKFIEICPEKAFQLAYELKIPSVLIAAFKILVNELAIDYASSDPSPGRPQLTWSQRRRDDYGDYPSDPVEYASRAFAERMNNQLKMLLSDEVFVRLPARIPEWDKLQYLGTLITSLGPGPLLDAYEALTAALLAVFHGWIDRALNTHYFSGRIQDLTAAQRAHYIPESERKPLIDLYRQLNPSQKVLTPFFWDRLLFTESFDSFAATFHAGHRLSIYDRNFKRHLRDALTSVPPLLNVDLTHPTLVAAANSPTLPFPDMLPSFHLAEFHTQLCAALKQLCTAHLHHVRDPDPDQQQGIPFFLSDHLLLSLDEHELNYLPIWADGLDDGSGGVFQDAIPEADMGPSEPGPGYHTGLTVATDADGETASEAAATVTRYAASTVAPSDLGIGALALGSDAGGSGTAAAAAVAERGVSLDVQRSGLSVTDTTGRSGGGVAPSEAFTAEDGDVEDMYAAARFAQPAAHQPQGQAIEQYVAEADEEGSAVGGPGAGGGYGDEGVEMEWDDSDDGSSTLYGFEEVDVGEAL